MNFELAGRVETHEEKEHRQECRVPGTPPLRVGILNFPQGWVLRSDEDRLGEFQFRKIPRISLWIERHKTIRVHHGM
jgi:hypothetical protein